ncbi:MAG: hypothetical protein K9L31_02110 [Candidatus Pacebacteria bacterium]|nr:hypothetical protein [Candidatus Paceibacterota bacterium]
MEVEAVNKKLIKTYKNLLTKKVIMNIIRVSKTEFEMEDGSIYPIEPSLEKELTLEEFKGIYGKTLETLRSCGIIGSDNADPTGLDE